MEDRRNGYYNPFIFPPIIYLVGRNLHLAIDMASEIDLTQFKAHRLAVIEYVEARTVPVDSEIHDQVHTLFHTRDTRRPFLQMIALVYQDNTDLFLEILTLLEHYTDSFRSFMPINTQIQIRKYRGAFVKLYSAMRRERLLGELARHAEKDEWHFFPNKIRALVDDLDDNSLEFVLLEVICSKPIFLVSLLELCCEIIDPERLAISKGLDVEMDVHIFRQFRSQKCMVRDLREEWQDAGIETLCVVL